MAVPVPQFSVTELQPLSVGTSSAPGAWATKNGISGLDCLIVNNGIEGAYIVFSTTPNPVALNLVGNVAGTISVFVPPNAVMVLGKGATGYFAAITDSGSTELYLHAGRGS